MAGQIQKLRYVNNKLGAGNANTQQTTRVIYDTNTITATGAQTQYFFRNFAGKTNPNFTNLTTNKLDSSDSMVVKWIMVEYLQDVFTGTPISPLNTLLFDLTLKVGNDVKIKNFPMFLTASESVAPFFQRLATDFNSANGASPIQTGMYLTTNLVIPPQVNFEVEVRFAQANTGAPDQNFKVGDHVCVSMGGYGQIFSAGASF